MFRIILVLSALALTGCAQFSGEMATVTGNGRFLVMTVGGAVVVQLDTDSPQACKDEGARIRKKPNLAVECSAISYEVYLPYAFSSVNVMTDIGLVMRVKTQDGCQLMYDLAQKEQTTGYRISNCKKSTTNSDEAIP